MVANEFIQFSHGEVPVKQLQMAIDYVLVIAFGGSGLCVMRG
jgi:hypothetical protein